MFVCANFHCLIVTLAAGDKSDAGSPTWELSGKWATNFYEFSDRLMCFLIIFCSILGINNEYEENYAYSRWCIMLRLYFRMADGNGLHSSLYLACVLILSKTKIVFALYSFLLLFIINIFGRISVLFFRFFLCFYDYMSIIHEQYLHKNHT